ncbi:MAG: hypothetical protein IPJ69_14335 [Deltaproteobacteria bacterium]|nr:MAG: hypothetical protein IPJ69_14335 [Deltaproteobacteria bacterium]
MNSLEQMLYHWLSLNKDIFTSQSVSHGIILNETTTSKNRLILFPEVKQWQVKDNSEGLGTYINLVFENGQELILCYAGFGFAPSYEETGVFGNLPPVVCFQDLHRMIGHVTHLTNDLSNELHYKEAVQTLLFCMAILKGAQNLQFEMAQEESLLEPLLEKLEKK